MENKINVQLTCSRLADVFEASGARVVIPFSVGLQDSTVLVFFSGQTPIVWITRRPVFITLMSSKGKK